MHIVHREELLLLVSCTKAKPLCLFDALSSGICTSVSSPNGTNARAQRRPPSRISSSQRRRSAACVDLGSADHRCEKIKAAGVERAGAAKKAARGVQQHDEASAPPLGSAQEARRPIPRRFCGWLAGDLALKTVLQPPLRLTANVRPKTENRQARDHLGPRRLCPRPEREL